MSLWYKTMLIKERTMKKYMLILIDNTGSYDGMSPEDYQKEIELHGKWMEELGDRYDSGEALEEETKNIQGKELIVTDGPFIESKELVGGFYIIKANSLEEATNLAKGCPTLRLGGRIEVRPVMHIPM